MRLFDASVLVAAFSREQSSTQALALLAAEAEPLVNALGLAEVRVSLIRKRKRGAMTSDEARRSLAELEHCIVTGLVRLVPSSEAWWDEAVAIADRVAVHVRTQDAVHAACAKLLGVGLVTFDADLAEAARAEGIPVTP